MKLALPTSLSGITRFVQYGDQPQPLRDWLVLASIAFLLLAGSAGWSYYLFQKISTEDVGGASVTTNTTVSIGSLGTVRSVFEKRSAEHARYLSGYTFVDPSR